MAIKTKKISDLSTIARTGSFVVGMKDSVTGKIAYDDIMKDVDAHIESAVNTGLATAMASIPATTAVDEVEQVSSEEIAVLQHEVSSTKAELAEALKTVKEVKEKYEKFAVSSNAYIVELQQKVTDLTVSNEKLIQFIKALQADGYLTLANIKKAAAEAFPIEESAE